MKKQRIYISAKLSLMMLFQHMLFAVWWVPFAAFLANINVTGVQNALPLECMPGAALETINVCNQHIQ